MSLKNVCLFCAPLLLAGLARAALPETVVVGNAGNVADSTGYGAVPYSYKIGKFEVTNAEYCEFLNKVAADDAYELYDGRMGEGGDGGDWGGILRSGDSGSFTYTVRDGMGKRPVGYLTVESAMRFANWLTNGQGKGGTETGTYAIGAGGFVTIPDHSALAGGKDVRWAIASENEWYKAAYFDQTKAGGAGYWSYAIRGGSAPEANLGTNNPTDGGSFKTSPSPNGTFDQNGNQWEYMDNQSDGKYALRGGSWWINDNDGYLLSSARWDVLSAKWPHYGFRVVCLGGASAAAAPAAAPK